MDIRTIFIIVGIVAIALAVVAFVAWRWSKREVRALLRRVGELPLGSRFELAWLLFRDQRLPLAGRAVLPALFVYLALPVDLIPDFIPVIGRIDDLLMGLAAVTLLLRALPRDVLESHLSQLEASAGRASVIDLPPSHYRHRP